MSWASAHKTQSEGRPTTAIQVSLDKDNYHTTSEEYTS